MTGRPREHHGNRLEDSGALVAFSCSPFGAVDAVLAEMSLDGTLTLFFLYIGPF